DFRLVRYRECDDALYRRDGDVLFVVEYIRHRGCLPKLIRGKFPKHFSIRTVGGHERSAILAKEYQTRSRRKDTCGSCGRTAHLGQMPNDLAGLNIDRAQGLRE